MNAGRIIASIPTAAGALLLLPGGYYLWVGFDSRGARAHLGGVNFFAAAIFLSGAAVQLVAGLTLWRRQGRIVQDGRPS